MLDERSVLSTQKWVFFVLPGVIDQYPIHILFILLDNSLIFEELMYIVHLLGKLPLQILTAQFPARRRAMRVHGDTRRLLRRLSL